MLYYAATKLATDGAVMVTGSHNPLTTTASRWVLGGGGRMARRSARLLVQAAAGDVVDETVAPERSLDVADDYVARLLADWDKGDRMLKGVGQRQCAAGEVLGKLVAGLPGEHTVLNGLIDGTFPAHQSGSHCSGEFAQLIAEVAAARRYRYCAGWRCRRIGLVDDKAAFCSAISCW